MQLTFEHVTHTYQSGSPFQATAIKDVNLTIHDGEFVALIGHTGSGKSTLAQHMNGLLTPSEGRVLLDGVDINLKSTDRREVRRRIGLVFQYPETQLFEETVRKDVAFGPKNLGLSQEEIDARVREAMTRVGLDSKDMLEKSPFELSGGQMRRVAMAGVLAMRPEVLVLDEPTAGLDPMGRDELLTMIHGLHEGGTTVIMISHAMDDVARYSTRIVVMDHGTIAMDGLPLDIFSQAEKLQSLGLDVPQVCTLSRMLQQAGIDFPTCYTGETALAALENLLKGERAC